MDQKLSIFIQFIYNTSNDKLAEALHSQLATIKEQFLFYFNNMNSFNMFYGFICKAKSANTELILSSRQQLQTLGDISYGRLPAQQLQKEKSSQKIISLAQIP